MRPKTAEGPTRFGFQRSEQVERSGANEGLVEVVGVEDEPVSYGVETRPFASTVLQSVNLCDDRIGVHRCGDGVALDQKDTGKITAFDRCYGQLDDAGQGLGNTAGREKDPSSLREGEGELRERVLLDDTPLFGNIQGVLPTRTASAKPSTLPSRRAPSSKRRDPTGETMCSKPACAAHHNPRSSQSSTLAASGREGAPDARKKCCG